MVQGYETGITIDTDPLKSMSDEVYKIEEVFGFYTVGLRCLCQMMDGNKTVITDDQQTP